MKLDQYFKSKTDIAEDVVYRWYSLVRNKHFNDRVVLPSLQLGLSHKLMKVNKIDIRRADQISIKVIQNWLTNCADMPWGDPDVMLNLVNEIESVLSINVST